MTNAKTVYVVTSDYASRKQLETIVFRGGYHPVSMHSLECYLSQSAKVPNACAIVRSADPLADVRTLKNRLMEQVEPPFIVVSSNVQVPEAVQIMKAGAIDLLTDPVCPELLSSAMSRALRRAEKSYKRQLDLATLRPRYTSLSPREKQVLPLIIGGFLNKQAASVLGIAEITLQIHRAQVMRKMKASSLPDLVRMALHLGIEPAPRDLVFETPTPYDPRGKGMLGICTKRMLAEIQPAWAGSVEQHAASSCIPSSSRTSAFAPMRS